MNSIKQFSLIMLVKHTCDNACTLLKMADKTKVLLHYFFKQFLLLENGGTVIETINFFGSWFSSFLSFYLHTYTSHKHH